MTVDDEDSLLAARAAKGDMAAFEKLIRKYHNDVFRYTMHYLRGNREDAYDVTQEVCFKAFKAIASYRGEASFKSWLLSISTNHCKDTFKKRKLDTTPLDDRMAYDHGSMRDAPDTALEASELGHAIDAALAQLPEKHRQSFILYEYEGLSYQEIAEIMQCSVGTVMSRLFYARKKLQHLLGSWFDKDKDGKDKNDDRDE